MPSWREAFPKIEAEVRRITGLSGFAEYYKEHSKFEAGMPSKVDRRKEILVGQAITKEGFSFESAASQYIMWQLRLGKKPAEITGIDVSQQKKAIDEEIDDLLGYTFDQYSFEREDFSWEQQREVDDVIFRITGGLSYGQYLASRSPLGPEGEEEEGTELDEDKEEEEIEEAEEEQEEEEAFEEEGDELDEDGEEEEKEEKEEEEEEGEELEEDEEEGPATAAEERAEGRSISLLANLTEELVMDESENLEGLAYRIKEKGKSIADALAAEQKRDAESAKRLQALKERLKRRAERLAAGTLKEESYDQKKSRFLKLWWAIKGADQMENFWLELKSDGDENLRTYFRELALENRKPWYIPNAHAIVVRRWLEDAKTKDPIPTDFILEHSWDLRVFRPFNFEEYQKRGALWAVWIAKFHKEALEEGTYTREVDIMVGDLVKLMGAHLSEYRRQTDWTIHWPVLFPYGSFRILSQAKIFEDLKRPNPLEGKGLHWPTEAAQGLERFVEYWRKHGNTKAYYDSKKSMEPYPNKLLPDLRFMGIIVWRMYKMWKSPKSEVTKDQWMEATHGPFHLDWDQMKTAIKPKMDEWGNWTGLTPLMSTRSMLEALL
ncbi:MAG TPA: hypothetical protein VJ327_03030 [Patescibacteria group bacterium]|nr:hypothetical protein [Patescibacteria group bacterium]